MPRKPKIPTIVAADQQQKPPRLLSKIEVLERVNLDYTTVWRKMREGTFPRSWVASDGRVRWLEAEINSWIQNLPARKLKGDAAA